MYEKVENSQTFIALFYRGGNGLDWFSSIRCPQSIQQQIKPTQSQSYVKISELKACTPKKQQNQTQCTMLEYNETQDIGRVWELTLEKSMGQKKKVNGIRLNHMTDNILIFYIYSICISHA